MKKFGLLVTAAAMLAPLAATAQEFENAGSWMVRVRGIAVSPDENSTTTLGSDIIKADTAYMPEIDLTYFVTDNIGLELIASTTKHNVAAVGTALGDLDLGSVWILPPTLTAQYHFPIADKVSVYAGAGINWSLFYSEKLPTTLGTDISYSNSVGPAVQLGTDIRIQDNLYLNLDVKKIWINTDVTIASVVGPVTADVDLDPWVFGVGVGWRF